jgi:hypothetical protein
MTILERVTQALKATVGDSPEPGQLYNHLAVTAINALLEAAAEEGWRMVPEETTEEMIKRGSEKEIINYYGANIVYDAMLTAAPKFEWDR